MLVRRTLVAGTSGLVMAALGAVALKRPMRADPLPEDRLERGEQLAA